MLSQVCSVHFVDGRPTEEHPYPELMLGHDLPIRKGRSRNKITRNAENKSTDPEAGGMDGVAQFLDITSKSCPINL